MQCVRCNMPLADGTETCPNCGCYLSWLSNPVYQTFLRKYENDKNIWLVVSIIMIAVGVILLPFSFGTSVMPLACGAWNIVSLDTQKKNLEHWHRTPVGVVDHFQDQGTNNIIFLIINIILAGPLGLILMLPPILLRDYVIKNRELLLALEYAFLHH